jgi:hypothetical protein
MDYAVNSVSAQFFIGFWPNPIYPGLPRCFLSYDLLFKVFFKLFLIEKNNFLSVFRKNTFKKYPTNIVPRAKFKLQK